MRSIGLDLSPWLAQGTLRVHATRPTAYGLETHLAALHKLVGEFEPRVVVVDPITSFLHAANRTEAEGMLMRLIDFLKGRLTTAIFTSLTPTADDQNANEAGISALTDTWLRLRDIELGGERNRAMYILKSRGVNHSNQIREFLLTDRGIELRDVYAGPEGVLTGSMRLAQESRERTAALDRTEETERRQRELGRKREALDASIGSQRSRFAAEEQELELLIAQERAAALRVGDARQSVAHSRRADGPVHDAGHDVLQNPGPGGRT